MAAPNAQPAGNRPGPAKVNTHKPHEGGVPSKGPAGSTTKPGSTKPIVQKPVAGGNKNRLR